MNTDSSDRVLPDLLGRGYRGWEYYAHPKSVTLPLYDLSPAANPVIDSNDTPYDDFAMIFGESVQDYTLKLSANIGVGPVTTFIKSLNVDFGSESISKSTSKFGAVTKVIAFRKAQIVSGSLTADAAKAIETMAPEQLLETYGTHYVRAVIIGGRLAFSSSFDSSELTENMSAKVVCDVGEQFMKIGKVEFGPSKNESVKKNILQRANLLAVGGDPTLTGFDLNDMNDGGLKSAKIDAWLTSIRKYPTIADFDAGGLVPIYELTKDEGRRALLRQAWKTFLTGKGALLDLTRPAGDLLRYGDPFYLQLDDKTYLSSAQQMMPQAWITAGFLPPASLVLDSYEYYPTLRAKVPVRLSISKPDDSDAGKPVASGEFVNVLSSESLTGALGGWGSNYNRLGAWGDDWAVYYYRAGNKVGGAYDQEQWSVQKVDGSTGPIRYGDRVWLESKSCPGQRLCPGGPSWRKSGAGFLTTKPASAGAWTIVRP